MSLCEPREKKDMKMDKSRGAIFKCLEEISKPQAYTEAIVHISAYPKNKLISEVPFKKSC